MSDRRAYIRALGTGVLLGLPVAFAATLFLVLLQEATDVVWHDLPDAAGWDEVPWRYLLSSPCRQRRAPWWPRQCACPAAAGIPP